jgi:hypothetical protein
VLTTTTTTTSSCPAPTSCGNEGVQWAYYNPDPENLDNTWNTNRLFYNYFEPAALKNATPQYNSTTSYISLPYTDGNSYISIYGSSKFTSWFFALNHRGYIYSELAGVYTFQSTAADDAVFFWGGPHAYSGWNKSNADAVDAINYDDPSRTFNVTLPAGIYYPFRITYANAATALLENISITAPDGNVIIGANSVPSPWVVQYSCDGILGPKFPAFGQET